ncbi:hypothetical protein NLG97_g4213 [Lecanicillium saksenae]|uniref:Uncharacterized protein n=1 Tax=Lecanicillium saksenae TaxID=468837 RepID=A0ACC1QZU4_9HYPO|nr:hypothetical protein NLG97_g4213 [Lecanicillium saksenae]
MPSWAQALLESWVRERRRSVDTTANMSISLGSMSSAPPGMLKQLAYRIKECLDHSPGLANAINPLVSVERTGVTDVKDGFYLAEYAGGRRIAQIYLKHIPTGHSLLSDHLLSCPGAMTLLVIADAASCGKLAAQAQRLVATADLPAAVMTQDSVVVYSPLAHKINMAADVPEKRSPSNPFAVYEPIVFDAMAPEFRCCGGYDAKAYVARLGKKTKFAIVRADFYVFATAKNDKQLTKCLEILANRVGNGPI